MSYIHAGNGPLVTNNPEAIATAIIDGGLKYMRGFALNVSGLGGTAEEQAAAEKFVTYLATKGFKNVHYVIDTGRSGINRPKHQNANAPYNSCNNFNAALGPRSTTKTTGAHADAYCGLMVEGVPMVNVIWGLQQQDNLTLNILVL